MGFIYQFATQPHLLLTRRYSGSDDNKNEIVFRHLCPAGQAATRELLQRLRTEAHSAIRKRLDMNLLYTDSQGDTITVVTKQSDHGEWTTTGDIWVRFSSATSAATAYEQQRNQHHNRDTQAERLLSYTGQVCLVFIPTGHTKEASQDDTLNKVFLPSPNFRGKDHAGLHQLFRDCTQEICDIS